MKEEKPKRGRPRKFPEKAEYPNPDCEPATKGYVKCIARLLVKKQTKHIYYSVGNRTGLLIALMTCVSFVVAVALLAEGELGSALMLGFVGLCLLAVTYEFENIYISGDIREPTKHIQKYVPPEECNPKKECE